MQLKQFYALTLALVLAGTSVYGQSRRNGIRSYWTLNPVVGAANYVGEFTTSDEAAAGAPDDQVVSLENTSYTLGLYAGYHFHPRLGVRFGLNYFNARGTDEDSRNFRRALEFTSSNIETSAMVTYELISTGRSIYSRPKWGAYLFGGAAVLYSNSSVTLTSPLGTPVVGPGGATGPVVGIEPTFNRIEDGGNIIVSIPFGIGTRYAVNDDWDITAEFGMRIGMADNLDGLVGLSNAYNDWYSLTTIGVRRILPNGNTERCARPRTKNKRSLLKRLNPFD